MMNLRSLDLNLLVVLDALLQEGHVSRAAERVGLSQPATSNALERLRHTFGDPLLERNGREMRLTPRAEALREPLRRALGGISDVVQGSAQPDLCNLRQMVRLVIADIAAAVLLPELYKRLALVAPGVDLAVLPWRSGAAAADGLGRGDLDLLVGTRTEGPDSLRWERLMVVGQKVLMRRDHPAADAFDLDSWIAYPHIVISTDGSRQSPVDAALAEIGRRRRVAMVLSSFLLIPPLLMETDLIALVPDSAGLRLQQPDPLLTSFAVPLAMPTVDIYMAWHVRRDDDVAVGLVRRLLSELVHEVRI